MNKNFVEGLALLDTKFYIKCNINKGIDREPTSDSGTYKHLFYNKCALESNGEITGFSKILVETIGYSHGIKIYWLSSSYYAQNSIPGIL